MRDEVEAGKKRAHKTSQRAEHADGAGGKAHVRILAQQTVEPQRGRRDGPQQNARQGEQDQGNEHRPGDEPHVLGRRSHQREDGRHEHGEDRGSGEQPA